MGVSFLFTQKSEVGEVECVEPVNNIQGLKCYIKQLTCTKTSCYVSDKGLNYLIHLTIDRGSLFFLTKNQKRIEDEESSYMNP